MTALQPRVTTTTKTRMITNNHSMQRYVRPMRMRQPQTPSTSYEIAYGTMFALKAISLWLIVRWMVRLFVIEAAFGFPKSMISGRASLLSVTRRL